MPPSIHLQTPSPRNLASPAPATPAAPDAPALPAARQQQEQVSPFPVLPLPAPVAHAVCCSPGCPAASLNPHHRPIGVASAADRRPYGSPAVPPSQAPTPTRRPSRGLLSALAPRRSASPAAIESAPPSPASEHPPAPSSASSLRRPFASRKASQGLLAMTPVSQPPSPPHAGTQMQVMPRQYPLLWRQLLLAAQHRQRSQRPVLLPHQPHPALPSSPAPRVSRAQSTVMVLSTTSSASSTTTSLTHTTHTQSLPPPLQLPPAYARRRSLRSL